MIQTLIQILFRPEIDFYVSWDLSFWRLVRKFENLTHNLLNLLRILVFHAHLWHIWLS